jgi:hypothetical protein
VRHRMCLTGQASDVPDQRTVPAGIR